MTDQQPSAREEELEALRAIYAGELRENEDSAFEIDIRVADDERLAPLVLYFRLPAAYPQQAPQFSIRCSPKGAIWLDRDNQAKLLRELRKLYEEDSLGEQNYVLRAISWLRDNAIEFLGLDISKYVTNTITEDTAPAEAVPPIMHGTPFTDRKSKFQAHLAEVHSRKDVRLVLDELYKNKKIATATHNIYAFRISPSTPNGSIDERSEDDGEHGAGEPLLHMMRALGAIDVLVVVTRWFGGILLGPDRFKHITNAGKMIIQEWLAQKEAEAASKPKSRLRTFNDVYAKIKWDEKYNTEDYIVGYEDRFDGIQEVSFDMWGSRAATDTIPTHRVRYIKHKNGQIVWDKVERIDNV